MDKWIFSGFGVGLNGVGSAVGARSLFEFHSARSVQD